MKSFDATKRRPLAVESALDATRFKPKNLAPACWLATAIFLLFSSFYALVSDLHSEPKLAIIHLGSAISLLVFWNSIHWGKGRYDTFGSALLLIYAFFKTQAAIDAVCYGSRINEIYYTVPLPENLTWLFLKSETLNHFGILLLVFVWYRIIGKNVGHFSFSRNLYIAGKDLPAIFYAAALFVELIVRVAGKNFGVFTQFSGLIYQFGVVSIFFIAYMQKGQYRQVMTALVLAVPMVLLALGTGMKENMVFPLVPAAIIIWFHFRSISLKIASVFFIVLLLAYSQLYVHFVRQVSWGAGGAKYSNAQLLEGFQRYLRSTSFSDGLESISSRVNMTISRATTVAIADARGFEPYNIFAPIPGSLIPRFLWPGKPVLMPGAQHTLRIHGINAPPREAWSATAAGFFTELYLGGGIIGWAFGIILYAVLLARIQLYTLRRLPGFGHLALSFTTVYWALRFEEKHIVYAYTGLIFTFLFLAITLKFFKNFKTNLNFN